jgi:hypothetical protein
MGYGKCREYGCVFFVGNRCTQDRQGSDSCEFIVYQRVSLFCAECLYYERCHKPYMERKKCAFWLEFCEARRRVLCQGSGKAGAKTSSIG